MMDTQVDRELLEKIADLIGKPVGAFNIRKDCGCDGRVSTEHIKIDDRTDGHAGIDIRILDGTKGETCHIPVIITKSGVEETVYNDFYIGRLRHPQLRRPGVPPRRHPHLPCGQKLPCPLLRKALR